MARVVVDVMLKPEILDPQGRAIEGALAKLGLPGASVRQGKRFEIDLDGDMDDERLRQLGELADRLLANPVIEDYRVRVEAGS